MKVTKISLYHGEQLIELKQRLEQKVAHWMSSWFPAEMNDPISVTVGQDSSWLKSKVNDPEVKKIDCGGYAAFIPLTQYESFAGYIAGPTQEVSVKDCSLTDRIFVEMLDELLVTEINLRGLLPSNLLSGCDSHAELKFLTVALCSSALQCTLLFPQGSLHSISVASASSYPVVASEDTHFATTRKDGIGKGRVKIQAELSTEEISIEELRSFQVGDVLRLNKTFSDKVLLRSDAGVELAKARLGAVEGNRAVQLLKNT